jgi:hypothetical protein
MIRSRATSSGATEPYNDRRHPLERVASARLSLISKPPSEMPSSLGPIFKISQPGPESALDVSGMEARANG